MQRRMYVEDRREEIGVALVAMHLIIVCILMFMYEVSVL